MQPKNLPQNTSPPGNANREQKLRQDYGGRPATGYAGKSALVNLHYLPSLEYFTCLLPYDTIRLETRATYQKKTYRNRCYILTSQSVYRLTVPVRKASSRLPYKMVEIDYSRPWQKLCWNTLCTAYRGAPYFAYFAEYFHNCLFRKHVYLFDLNLTLLHTCLQLLQLDKKIELSEHYDKELPATSVDVRHNMHPRNRLARSHYYQPVRYRHVFGEVFHPNLSIVDLLFCEGHNARTILSQSRVNYTANQ